MSKTVVLILLYCFTVAYSGKLELHSKDGQKIVLGGEQCDSGAIFNQNKDFYCACVTGLWVLFEDNCERAHSYVGGMDGECFPINSMTIRKVTLLSPLGAQLPHSAAVALDKDSKSIGIKLIGSKAGTLHFVPPENPIVIIIGTQAWRLPSKNKCLRPLKPKGEATEICIFNHETEAEYPLEEGCLSGDKVLSPITCMTYFMASEMAQKNPKSCNFEKKTRVKRDDDEVEGYTEEPTEVIPMEDETAGWEPNANHNNGNGQGDFTTEAPPHPPKPKNKPLGRTLPTGNEDEDENDDDNKPGSRPQGRVFLNAIQTLGNSTPPEVSLYNTSIYDENHNLTVTLTHPKMNSELWNYMTVRAQDLLGIRSPKKDLLDSPAFLFLDICKEILQNVCPTHYVRPEHFDLAVGTFISLQRNRLQFVDTFVDLGTKERIENSLRACMENKTVTYPFLERTPNGKPCPGHELIEHGQFEAFGKRMHTYMTTKYSGLMQEPIVETVWKIFVHGHSACYSHFRYNLNDHHRFTTIMLNLFTNDVSDIWLTGEPLKSDIYAGFLGDARDLIMSIDYCTVMSRMESEYPWDLPRPGKDGATTLRRRKREAGNPTNEHECLQEMDARDICPSETGFRESDYDDYSESLDLGNEDSMNLDLDLSNDLL
ncbi:unnamed protein product [Orchesella dallaii]|uniref:Uncharacterized protein n=1 Tax=Orchesella dallaii TaxID=48710 RepID=A0ABP1S968_9HEXA